MSLKRSSTSPPRAPGSATGKRSASPSSTGKQRAASPSSTARKLTATTSRNRNKKKQTNQATSDLASKVLKEGTYTQRTIWSPGFKGWAKNYVKKPRLPTDADKSSWVESVKFKPSGFRAIQGSHNAPTVKLLQSFVDHFESVKSIQDLTILHGPSGSGKSMLAYIYTQELAETMDLSTAQYSRWVLTINADDYDDVSCYDMMQKIIKFIEPKMDKNAACTFRIVIIDNADNIGHSNQTTLKKLMDSNLLKLKWIFTVNNVKNLIGGYQTKGQLVQTQAASEKNALLVLLNILRQGKIGHERQGLRKIFDVHRSGTSISKMLDLAQKTFLKFHYISEENVTRASGTAPAKRLVSPFAPIGEEPLPRCKVCTLHPPCKHHKLDFLLDRAARIRERLQTQQTQQTQPGHSTITCPTYALTGRCEVYNKHGRCSLHHPERLHIIQTARRVCPLCTIVWPCNHCQYSVERDRLVALLAHVKARLALLAEINVPEPPAYLIRKIVDAHEDWQEQVQQLAGFYLTSSKQEVLTATLAWIDTSYSSDRKEYLTQQQLVTSAFKEVLRSDILELPVKTAKAGKGSSLSPQGRRSGNDDESVTDTVESGGGL